ERWIFYRRVEPGRSFHHGFLMTEGVERKFSVIRSDATVASSPEWKMIVGEVPACIVDAAAAKWNFFQPFSLSLTTLSKHIKCQWIGIAVDNFFCFLPVLKADDGKEWTKNFFTHHRFFQGNIFQKCGFQIQQS